MIEINLMSNEVLGQTITSTVVLEDGFGDGYGLLHHHLADGRFVYQTARLSTDGWFGLHLFKNAMFAYDELYRLS